MSAEREDDIRANSGYDHRDPQIVAAPFKTWEKLRDCCPVAWSDHYGGFWFVSTFDLVHEIVVDWREFTSTESTGLPRQATQHLPNHVDPPEHRRYRAIINPTFAPQSVAVHEPWIRDLARQTLEEIDDPDTFDLCSQYADPVPQVVIMRLAGFPLEDLETVAEWIDCLTHGTRDDERGAKSISLLEEYLYARLDDRGKSQAGPDLLSVVEQSTVDGVRLSRDEQVRMLTVVLLGGLATTSSAISGTLLWLHEHPDDRAALANDEIWKTASEEFVRYTSPVAQLSRVATVDSTLGECPIKKGDRLLFGLGSANRDPSKFEFADQVILDRFPNQHLGFGAGPHRCVGSHLAKLQLRVAVEEFLRRFPDYSVDVGSARWRGAEDRGLAYLRTSRGPEFRRDC
jgi:cytochrome P450